MRLLAMSERRREFMESLTDGEKIRAQEIRSSWLGLGIKGCAECKVPRHFIDLFNGDFDPALTGILADRLTHYAIELNGLKRSVKASSGGQNQHEYDPDALFDTAIIMGIKDDQLDDLSNDFEDCIACPGALSTTGKTPSFENLAKIILDERNN